MALFTDIIRNISSIAEEDRAALAALAEKYPDLDGIVARKRDADEAVAKAAGMERELADLKGKVSSWDRWAEENFIFNGDDPSTGVTKAHQATLDELALAKRRVAEFEAGNIPSGEEMDFNSIKEQLSGVFATKDSLTGLAKAEDFKATQDAVNNQARYFEHFYAATSHLPGKFYREYGAELAEDFQMGQFIQFVSDPAHSERRLTNIDEAYQEFCAPAKQRLEMRKQQKEIEDARAKLEADRAALEAARTAGPSPTDSQGGNAQSLGTLDRRRQQADDKAPNLEGMELGKGQLAALAEQRLKTEGTLIRQVVN